MNHRIGKISIFQILILQCAPPQSRGGRSGRPVPKRAALLEAPVWPASTGHDCGSQEAGPSPLPEFFPPVFIPAVRRRARVTKVNLAPAARHLGGGTNAGRCLVSSPRVRVGSGLRVALRPAARRPLSLLLLRRGGLPCTLPSGSCWSRRGGPTRHGAVEQLEPGAAAAAAGPGHRFHAALRDGDGADGRAVAVGLFSPPFLPHYCIFSVTV